MKPCLARVLRFLAVLMVINPTVQAATKTWNIGNGTWDTTSSNWTGTTWANGNDATFSGAGGTITLGSGFTPTVGTSSIAVLTFSESHIIQNGSIYLASNAGYGSATTGDKITVASGKTATLDGISLTWGTAGVEEQRLSVSGSGTLSLNNSSLTGGQFYIGNADGITGNPTNGHVIQSAGAVTLNSALYLGDADAETDTYQLESGNISIIGTQLANGLMIVGRRGNATFTQDGGSVTVERFQTPVAVLIGYQGTSTYSMSGGTFNVLAGAGHESTTTLLGGGGAGGGNGTLSINGTTAQANLTLISLGNAATGTGTINLQAGTLRLAGIEKTTGSTGNFNFSGGLLAPYNANASIGSATAANNFDITLTGTAAKISSSDKDAAGRTVNVYGKITSGGALTIGGTGTMVLHAANDYTGATSVESGKLLINGNIVTSPTTVKNTGTLGGSGTVGAVIVQAGGRLAPGSGIDSLTAQGNVSFNANSTFEVEIDTAYSHDTLDITSGGTLNIASGTKLDLLNFGSASSISINSRLQLIDYTGGEWSNGLFTIGNEELSDSETFVWQSNTWRINYDDTLGIGDTSQSNGGSRVTLTLIAANAPTTRTELLHYTSSVTNDANGPLDLTSEVNYDTAMTKAPVMVLMHAFSDLSTQYDTFRDNAAIWRDAGFFVITPAMRQREGCDGIRDNGGVEIHDVYDAVESAKITYAAHIDPSSISITGYSGGGGNTMSALTKFPDYFRAASAYFGMSDYGYDTANGWYFNGATSGHQTILNAAPGNPTLGSSAVKDRYQARASNLASKNNPYAEIHLFVNDDEITCPRINSVSYRDNAVAAASSPGEFANITVHIGQPSLYQDFNGNSINEANELQYWPHGNLTSVQQHAGDNWFLARLRAGQIAAPELKTADSLFVAGYVRTKRFTLWLGDGQNAAADLDYSLSPASKSFTMNLRSILSVTGKITIDTADMNGKVIQVLRNGVLTETLRAVNLHIVPALADDESIELKVASPLEAWRFEEFGTSNPADSGDLADPDHDGISNLMEFAMRMDPHAPATSADLPLTALATGQTADDFLFTFRQRTGGVGTHGIDYHADGIRYVVETSETLSGNSWSGGPTKITPTGEAVALGNGMESVTVRISSGTSGHQFARLKILTVE